MHNRTRIYTPARVIALTVIAVLAAGLAYLRFEPDHTVSVPAGAKAGELTDLKPCDYKAKDGTYKADCGTLVVSENRADPQSRLIALPVTRIRARSEHPDEPIFRLEGGPGITNMEFPFAGRFADEHDVVLVGYRGIDSSSVLDCPEVESALKHNTDFLDDDSKRAYTAGLRSCAERLQDDGVDLAGYTLPQRVDDLEDARRALGYDRIDLISESVGTRTAMIYSWRHPEAIHRSVMIGVNPPGGFLWDGPTTDAQLERYSRLCAADQSCSERGAEIADSMRTTAGDMPDKWGFLPIHQGNARLASFYGLMETTEEAPLMAPRTLHTWQSAAKGDASGLWFMSFLAEMTFPESFVWGEVAATARMDTGRAREYFAAGGDPGSILGNAGTEFLWADGELADAWPSNPDDDAYSRVPDSDVETLLIGGTLDLATPARFATEELLPHLSNGHQVVLREMGHSTDFWNYQPKASSHLVNTFLDRGEVDDSRYSHQKVDFDAEVTNTALAKGFLATMLGFGALTLLSLMWLPLRVRRRGRIGRKASAWLRSAFTLVLGLGGWFIAVLTVMTVWPTLALDNVLLGVLPTGVPVGLGIYFAWLQRDRARETKRTGFAAAMGGALAGAWLGFHVAVGLLSLITTIAGAAIAANLALLLYDIARERATRDRLAAAGPAPASRVVRKEYAGVG